MITLARIPRAIFSSFGPKLGSKVFSICMSGFAYKSKSPFCMPENVFTFTELEMKDQNFMSPRLSGGQA